MLKLGVISLFPEMFAALGDYGVSGRALKEGLVSLQLWNPRDFTEDKHRTVDDRPYGGGPGMVMKVEPLKAALQAAKAALPAARVIYMSPQAPQRHVLRQELLENLAAEACDEAGLSLIIIAGRYEGLDERFIQQHVDEEWSIGDYVLSGGELAAMVLLDGLIRLLPGVLGHEASAQQDSFAEAGANEGKQRLLDCPHYTRPECLESDEVPPVLLSGNHADIACWRRKQQLGRTWQRRPDLIQRHLLSAEDEMFLQAYLVEQRTVDE